MHFSDFAPLVEEGRVRGLIGLPAALGQLLE